MEDPLLVRVGERLGHLQGDPGDAAMIRRLALASQ